MPETFQVPLGPWWRLDRCEVRDGYVRAGSNARLEQYDPWDEYRRARSGRKERRGPHESLLALLQGFTLRPGLGGQLYGLKPEDEASLQAWCEKHGLLGILPHRAQMLTLAPRWEPPLVTVRRQSGILRPTLRQYSRTTVGWVSLPDQHEDSLRDQPERTGQVVPDEHLPEGWPLPGGLLQNVQTGAWEHGTLSETWARFFPGVPENERETYSYPLPLSEEFWSQYAEPVDDFIDAARALYEALWPLRRVNLAAKATEDDVFALLDMLRRLENLTAPIRPGLMPRDDRSFRQVWRSPSLLASLAMMALIDLTGQRPLLSCSDCGTLFFSTAYQAAFCSDRCRNRAQKRKFRATHPD